MTPNIFNMASHLQVIKSFCDDWCRLFFVEGWVIRQVVTSRDVWKTYLMTVLWQFSPSPLALQASWFCQKKVTEVRKSRRENAVTNQISGDEFPVMEDPSRFWHSLDSKLQAGRGSNLFSTWPKNIVNPSIRNESAKDKTTEKERQHQKYIPSLGCPPRKHTEEYFLKIPVYFHPSCWKRICPLHSRLPFEGNPRNLLELNLCNFCNACWLFNLDYADLVETFGIYPPDQILQKQTCKITSQSVSAQQLLPHRLKNLNPSYQSYQKKMCLEKKWEFAKFGS